MNSTYCVVISFQFHLPHLYFVTHMHATHTHTHTQGGAAVQVEEIKRVVELNVKNVVEFEIDRHQVKKTVTPKD